MTWEQTAEVLAKEVDRLQKRVDELDFENKLISKILHGSVYRNENVIQDLVGALVAIRKLRTVGGAWDDGTVMEIVRAALKKYGKGGGAANGGESQALQAAILGLHTLAGEFPTATWKTREDYLQATISEINEILINEILGK